LLPAIYRDPSRDFSNEISLSSLDPTTINTEKSLERVYRNMSVFGQEPPDRIIFPANSHNYQNQGSHVAQTRLNNLLKEPPLFKGSRDKIKLLKQQQAALLK